MTFSSGPISRDPIIVPQLQIGNLADMSLLKNVTNQNFTFALINVTNDAALTGATVVGKTSRDGGAQASVVGTVTNLGNGQYDYAPTQAETNGANVSFLFTAAGDVPQNLSIFTVP